MKKRIFLIATAVAFFLSSCSKDVNNSKDVNKDLDGKPAYLSIAISMPDAATKADPTQVNGTAEESKASDVRLIGFDNFNTKQGVYVLSPQEYGTIGANGTPAVAGDAIPVKSGITKIMIVINPTAKLLSNIDAATDYSSLNQVITSTDGEELKNMTTANHFMMVSAGETVGDKGLTSVTPAATAAEAKANPVRINVDRSMSKVNVTKDKLVAENGKAKITGYLLQVTNKSYFPYADFEPAYTATDAKYRVDPNYNTIKTDEESYKHFNWYRNPDTHTWNVDFGTAKYCFENTIKSDDQNFRNTTSVLIKATFTPYKEGTTTIVGEDESWFRVAYKDSLKIYTMDHLDSAYTRACRLFEQDPTSTDKARFKIFLDTLLGTTRTVGFSKEVADGEKATIVKIADLDKVPNGGFQALKIRRAVKENYMIEYFQKSICYYEARILHDNRVQKMGIGRWGVVRNNFYNISIDKIRKPGTPFIPELGDLTPGDDPDDEPDAFISVAITINPWTSWTQSVDLGEKPQV